ncbi:MAG TPA: S16 family serine protease [Polyangia bacterium]|nr:S16 family serine protease [Polyangia bacterium]
MPFLDELKREVVLRPQDAQARYTLAEALFAETQYAAAAKQLEKALSLDPEHGNARRLLARALERDGRGGEALKTLEDLARRDPGDLSARDELMEMLLSMGRVDDALLHAEEAAKIAPNDPKRFITVGELCRQKMLWDRARGAFETAHRLAPADPQIGDLLRELYLELGDEAASERMAGARGRSYFVAQAKQALANQRLRAALVGGGALDEAARALEAGDVAGAKRALGRASADEHASASYEFLHGELLLIEGDLDRAESAFRTCIERSPELGVAWNRLGDLTQTRGKLREALPFYKKAVLLTPDDANAYEDLGDLYATLGDADQARKMYQAAQKRDPSAKAADKLRSLDAPSATQGSEEPQIGRIGVLGWTPRGGAVSPLEAVAVVGKGELIFSGNVGPTGREAGLVAFSCLKARAHDLQIDELVVRHDLHLHFTDTEFGKDGPSSGLALVLAGISAYTRRALKPRLAATGEITIHGEVKPVGGIHEKVVAAHLAGIRTVLMPRRNLREGRELPDEVAARMELIYVDSVAEAITKALSPAKG